MPTTAETPTPRDVLSQLDVDNSAEYRAFISDVASGTIQDPDFIRTHAASFGRDTSTLKADVERILERREAVEQIKNGQALKDQCDELKAEQRAIGEQLEALNRQHREATHPLHIKAQDLEAQRRVTHSNALDKISQAERVLQTTADPSIDVEIMKLRSGPYTWASDALRGHGGFIVDNPRGDNHRVQITSTEHLEGLIAKYPEL
ncbi:MAG: hypothetical protein RJP95_03660, partial [Pirellulales bacterium]